MANSLDAATQPRNSSDCERVLQEVKPDVIVHTAALSSPAKCEEDEALSRSFNVPRHFAEKAKELNPATRFIFLSTDQVHDGKGRMVDESTDPRPMNVYGKSKMEMETVVKEVFDNYAIFRLSFVFGPEVEGAHSTFLQFAMDKLRQKKQFDAFSDQIRSCIYIDDVIEALRLSVKGHIEGTVNLGGPEPLSRLDFCRIVAKHFKIDESICQGALYHLPTPSPADISMNITLLEKALGRSPRSEETWEQTSAALHCFRLGVYTISHDAALRQKKPLNACDLLPIDFVNEMPASPPSLSFLQAAESAVAALGGAAIAAHRTSLSSFFASFSEFCRMDGLDSATGKLCGGEFAEKPSEALEPRETFESQFEDPDLTTLWLSAALILQRNGFKEVRTIGEGSFGQAVLVEDEQGSKLVCKLVDVREVREPEWPYGTL
eukprot:symbB.v1.2.025878.t3/scaffold2545.1/size76554/1